MAREATATQALLDKLNTEAGGEAVLNNAIGEFVACLYRPREVREAEARHTARQLVQVVQAILLMQEAPACVAQQFIASRLQSSSDIAATTRLQISAIEAAALLERAWPGA